MNPTADSDELLDYQRLIFCSLGRHLEEYRSLVRSGMSEDRPRLRVMRARMQQDVARYNNLHQQIEEAFRSGHQMRLRVRELAVWLQGMSAVSYPQPNMSPGP
jgi:hypothetical protein